SRMILMQARASCSKGWGSGGWNDDTGLSWGLRDFMLQGVEESLDEAKNLEKMGHCAARKRLSGGIDSVLGRTRGAVRSCKGISLANVRPATADAGEPDPRGNVQYRRGQGRRYCLATGSSPPTAQLHL